MSKKNLSLLMDGFVGDTNQSESIQEESKEQAEQPAVQTDKQENLETAPSKIASKKGSYRKNEIPTGGQTQGKCELPQERQNSQKCQETPGNPNHLHRGSGFGPQGEVHFPRERYPPEGRYLRGSEQLCGAWEEKNKKIRLPKAK